MNVAEYLNQIIHKREIDVIQRRGEEDVDMISAGELESLTETAYLLRSPKNAERLLFALSRALQKEGEALSINDLRGVINLE